MTILTPSGGDDTAAIQAALATDRVVRLEGDFLATGDLTISQQGARLKSDDGATITFTTPDRPGIVLSGWLSDVEISGITLDRNAPATSGGNGIECAGVSCNNAWFHDLKIRDQYIGMNLGVTAWSHVEHVVIDRCAGDGLRMVNGLAGGTSLQWQLDDILVQRCGGRGFLAVAVAGSPQISLGNWNRIATWANSGTGVAVIGRADCPIHGVRISGGFLGQDGNHELFLDTYGGLHVVSDVFVELAGKALTGPTLSAPASNLGYGVYVSANNTDFHGVNLRAKGNSQGSFRLFSAQQMVREGRNNAGGLVNVAGPTTVA